MEDCVITTMDTICEECGADVKANIPPIGDDLMTWAVYHCSKCGHDGKMQLLRTANGNVEGVTGIDDAVPAAPICGAPF